MTLIFINIRGFRYCVNPESIFTVGLDLTGLRLWQIYLPYWKLGITMTADRNVRWPPHLGLWTSQLQQKSQTRIVPEMQPEWRKTNEDSKGLQLKSYLRIGWKEIDIYFSLPLFDFDHTLDHMVVNVVTKVEVKFPIKYRPSQCVTTDFSIQYLWLHVVPVVSLFRVDFNAQN